MEQKSNVDEEFIDHLLKEKQRLWGEVRRELFEQIGEKLHSEYSVPQDTGDSALIDLLEDTGLAVTDIRHQELLRIDDTIKRVKEGRYGLCEDCGRKIGRGRLRVAPYAPCCIDCQEKREAPGADTSHTL
ncbi:MAG TPA: TraR/DksA family transcriptional regulator [Pelovirga sp.]|nr:TraR/DksA family transcriptional regulator [Pelovirga sp.]